MHIRGCIPAAVCLLLVGCTSGGKSAAQRAMGGGSLFAPKGQPWTIQCIELQGPHAADNVEQLAETLTRTPGIRKRDVSFSHDSDGFSRLYYGTYYRRMDLKTGKRSIPDSLRKDILHIKELSDEGRRRYFLHAMLVPTPTPDAGNPAWALESVNAKYTLQVAVFVPDDVFHEQKEAAARYCEYLREQGFEAYYYHGTALSMVTVGAFGPEAVLSRKMKVPLTTEGAVGRVDYTYYSGEVVALQKNELLKYNLVNGATVRERIGNRLGPPVASQLVHIPKRAGENPW